MIEFYALGQKVITFFMVKIAARSTQVTLTLPSIWVSWVSIWLRCLFTNTIRDWTAREKERIGGPRDVNGGSTTADASSCTYDY